jgi:hypothetical protein
MPRGPGLATATTSAASSSVIGSWNVSEIYKRLCLLPALCKLCDCRWGIALDLTLEVFKGDGRDAQRRLALVL